MSTGQGSTISDAPVTARAIDLYELSGILLPGILVAAAALLCAHLTYGKELEEIVGKMQGHQKWDTVMTVLMLSTFFAISYLLGNVCVIFGQVLFNTLIMDVLVGPPIVVLAFPHLSPAYRRSPKAAIMRLLLFSLVGFVTAPQVAHLLAQAFPSLAASTFGGWFVTRGDWLANRGFWFGIAVFCYLTYQAYYGYEMRIAQALGIRNRTDIDREMIERSQGSALDTKQITRKMEFDLFASTWAILPLGRLRNFFAREADSRCRRVDSRYRDSSRQLSVACRSAIAAKPYLFASSVVLTLAMAFVSLCNLPLRLLENAFLKTLLCVRPLSSYSLMHVLSHFLVIRRSTGIPDNLYGRLADANQIEAYYAIAVDDSFRLLLSQVLANIGDSTAGKNGRNFQLFRIVHNACGAMISIALLFSVVADSGISERLSLAATVLAFILMLRGIFLRYQVYERELYVAFGGLPIELLRKYFDQPEKPRVRVRADGTWVQVPRY